METSFKQLPATLKGMDKIVFESLSRLDKVQVKLRHNLEHDFDWDDERFAEKKEEYESDYDDDNDFPLSHVKQKGDRAILSKHLVPFRLTEAGLYDDGEDDEMASEWDAKHTIEHVVWMNRPNVDQPALVHGTVSYACTTVEISRILTCDSMVMSRASTSYTQVLSSLLAYHHLTCDKSLIGCSTLA